MSDFIDNSINLAFQSEKLKKILFAVILFLIICGIYGFNSHTPLIADDLVMLVFLREHSLCEIIRAFYDYYLYWGGRIVVHVIAMFFLSLDKNIFNVANTLAYTLLNILILFHGLGKKFYSPVALIFVNLMIFLYTPAFGQDFLWLDGAANYLWGMVIVLIFLIPYRLQMTKSENIFKREKLFLPIVFFAGIIAGWTNENISLALIFTVFFCAYCTKKYYNRFFKWQTAGFVGTIIGALFLLLAPGNFNRLTYEGGGQHIDAVKNFFDISALFVDCNFLLYPLFFTALFALLTYKPKEKIFYFPYLAGFFISMYSMIGAPYYTDRAKLGSLVLLLILTLYFYNRFEFNKLNEKKAVLFVSFFLTFLFYAEWHTANGDIKEYDRKERDRIEIILNERDINDEIVLEDNIPFSRYVSAYGLDRLSTDKNYGLNKSYAEFYNVKSVRIK